MFETLFKYPRVVARHRTGPCLEARERFLTHCVSQGLAGATLLRHGHRSAEATRIYAKVDLVGLREVANFDLGGLR